MPFRLIYSLFALSFLLLPNFSYALEARIAAVVNGEIITYYDLERRASFPLLENNLSIDNKSQQVRVKQILQETLQTMIDEEILIQEAYAQGIRSSESLVDQELSARVQGIGISKDEYLAEMKNRFGYSERALREEIANTILISQLIGRNVHSKIAVSDEEIMAYYTEHQGSFGTKKAYDFALILYASKEDAQKYSTQLLDGTQGSQNFEAIARQISIGPNQADGGAMGNLEADDIAPNIAYELQSMKENDVSKLIDLSGTLAQVKLFKSSDL